MVFAKIVKKSNMLKCFKKALSKRRLMKISKTENGMVRKYCGRRDWDNAKIWLERNKITFKTYRKIEKL